MDHLFMMANFSVTHSKLFDEFIKKHLPLERFSILPLAGDASSRKYYRINKDSLSWVLMEWEAFEKPASYPFISIQKHFAANKIDVPEIFAYDNTTGLFLLEDLGDLTLERRFGEFLDQDKVLPFYHVCLDQLIRLHRLYLDPANRPHCTAYSVAFDVEKFSWEMNYTFKNLFTVLCPHKLEKTAEAPLQEEFMSIAKTLAGLPQVLCHRDFHSRNVMIKGEKIYFIDFQDARLGPPQYDLVSLVHDSYVNLSEAHADKLIEYYITNGPQMVKLFGGREEFMKYFELQKLQRCFKACGTFAAVFNQRGDERYLKYLPYTLKKVKAAIKHFPEYKTLNRLIEQLQLPQIEKWP